MMIVKPTLFLRFFEKERLLRRVEGHRRADQGVMGAGPVDREAQEHDEGGSGGEVWSEGVKMRNEVEFFQIRPFSIFFISN